MRTRARRRPDTAGEGSELQLRQLLDLEHRLEQRVGTAAEEAVRAIAAAHAAQDQRLAAAREAAAHADAERAHADRAAHADALAAIEAASRTAVAAITSLPDERIDELARWALAEAIRGEGEPP